MTHPLADLFKFDGRLGRMDYVYNLLIAALVGIMIALVAVIVAETIRAATDLNPMKTHAMLVFAPAFVFVIVAAMASLIRRWHDFGVSAWISVPLFVLMLGDNAGLTDVLIIGLPALIPSTPCENRYGSPPANGALSSSKPVPAE